MLSRSALYCPSCHSKNVRNKLKLYQISLTTGVYLCEDKRCKYPMGYNWIEVQRSLEELLLEKQQSTGDSDLDNWLEEVFEREAGDVNLSQQSTATSTYNDNFLNEIFSEIDCGLNGTFNNGILQPQSVTKSTESTVSPLQHCLHDFAAPENESETSTSKNFSQSQLPILPDITSQSVRFEKSEYASTSNGGIALSLPFLPDT